MNKINAEGFFTRTFHRVSAIDSSQKAESHFSRFNCEKYELLIHAHTYATGEPYVRMECRKNSDSTMSRFTPYIYIIGDEGVFGGDPSRPMDVSIETTSFGSLSIKEIEALEEELAYARKVATAIMEDFIKPILAAGNNLSETGLLLDMPEGFRPGDTVRTPRFLNVKITDAYASADMMMSAGYTEPTHFDSDNVVVCGQSTGEYMMEFAAAKKGE